jgi:hypothetical protein
LQSDWSIGGQYVLQGIFLITMAIFEEAVVFKAIWSDRLELKAHQWLHCSFSPLFSPLLSLDTVDSHQIWVIQQIAFLLDWGIFSSRVMYWPSLRSGQYSNFPCFALPVMHMSCVFQEYKVFRLSGHLWSHLWEGLLETLRVICNTWWLLQPSFLPLPCVQVLRFYYPLYYIFGECCLVFGNLWHANGVLVVVLFFQGQPQASSDHIMCHSTYMVVEHIAIR